MALGLVFIGFTPIEQPRYVVAVVAEEVRSLAQRSTEAARNSANLIEECMASARGGVDLSGAAMENLREVADRAERVLGTISGIRDGSLQQELRRRIHTLHEHILPIFFDELARIRRPTVTGDQHQDDDPPDYKRGCDAPEATHLFMMTLRRHDDLLD